MALVELVFQFFYPSTNTLLFFWMISLGMHKLGHMNYGSFGDVFFSFYIGYLLSGLFILPSFASALTCLVFLDSGFLFLFWWKQVKASLLF
ncbi:hypothetical protein B0T21DRAFT_370434 [Apiosordaria backusii]|uniref:Uncharacterized protein n=1 Tax=Apiosordaria backusii TaxID=314023 RepID=A0AA40E9K9_9PEZI|nr:hypothetical protein B0T21DRAFT_370434 [Apiosordaria backusii]